MRLYAYKRNGLWHGCSLMLISGIFFDSASDVQCGIILCVCFFLWVARICSALSDCTFA